MNFFVTLLAIVLALNVLYHYARYLFVWLKTVIPLFFHHLFTALHRLTRRLVQLYSLCRATQPSVKQLNRTSAVRRTLSSSIEALEKANGRCWQLYVTWIPSQYRHIERQDASVTYPLPWWLEQIAVWLNNKTIMAVLKFLVLYLVLISTMHLWLPYVVSAPLHPLDATQLTLYQQLNVVIEPCLRKAEEPHDQTCFLKSEDMLECSDLDRLAALEIPRSLIHTASLSNLSLLIDSEHNVYYAAELFGDKTSRYMSTEKTLAPLLKESGETCICALFLNLANDISLLYEQSEQRWLVMHQAFISRNNTFAELVASKIAYSSKSRFFNTHRHWHSILGINQDEEELVHYDSFVVEYNQVPLPSEEVSQDYPSFENIRLFRRLNASWETRQVHLSGSDAICFVYCDRLSKAVKNE